MLVQAGQAINYPQRKILLVGMIWLESVTLSFVSPFVCACVTCVSHGAVDAMAG